MGRDLLALRLAGERRPAGDQVVEGATEAVNVGAGVGQAGIAAGLLRRQVIRRAHDGAVARQAGVRLGRPGAARRRANPRSSTLTVAPSAVRIRLAGFTSRCTSPRSWACCNPSAACRAYSHASAAGSGPCLDELAKVLAFDVFHRQEMDGAGLVGVVDKDDIGVRQAGGGAALAPEALDGLRTVHVFGANDLEGDEAVEDAVMGLVDRAHAAGADAVQQQVLPEDQPGRATVKDFVDLKRR